MARVGALSLAVGAAALAAESLYRFRSRGTTVNPFAPGQTSVLVTDGASAITRNPMYVSMAGGLFAHAVLRRSWSAGGLALAFIVVMTKEQIATEERELSGIFGDHYDRYLRDVPRWLDRRSLVAAAGALTRR